MAWVHRVGREFKEVLCAPETGDERCGPYVNEDGIPGWRFEVNYNKRKFYISQSRIIELEELFSPDAIWKIVLKNPNNIDSSKSPIYVNRDLGEGLRVEAWLGKRWFQVFTPDNEQQPDDKFRRLIHEISFSNSR